MVFRAWVEPELFQRWWVPRARALHSCPARWGTSAPEANTGWSLPPAVLTPWPSMASIPAVVPDERIVWTNEEEDEGAVTTVTFENQGGKTLLTFHELGPLPRKQPDEAMAGSAAGLPAQLDQLDGTASGDRGVAARGTGQKGGPDVRDLWNH